MDVRDLRAGDVLLFSPEKGSWISKAITWLTDAPVSHAAMTYQIATKIIEETPPAVRVAEATLRFVDRTISVMRFNKPVDSFAPVMNIATGYLNKQEPYAMSNLYLIGMLLIYKKFTPSDPVQRVTLKILKKLTAKIISAINEHQFPNKMPMVCSQFVFECYQEAGRNYHLTIKGGNLAASNKRTNLLFHAYNHQYPDIDLLHNSENHASDEELAKELYTQLSSEQLLASGAISSDILNAIHEFAKALHAVANNTSYQLADSKKGIAILEAQSSLFVTPGDLLQHCPELDHIGDIKIK
ncbi:MAG: hypothetical protein HWD86_04310 [Kangiellaceae bacterium]|nr:hypothetical protein [Kangiellaceae bacterium]